MTEVTETQNYKTVTVEEVLGRKAFKHVDNATEFLFLYALKKELEAEGLTLDLTTFEYDKCVFLDEYFGAIAKKDPSVRALTDLETLGKTTRVDTKVFFGTVKGVKFDAVAGVEGKLVFSETKYAENDKVRGTGDTSTKYIALCARAFVECYLKGIELKELIIDNLKGEGNTDNYTLLPILIFYGSNVLAHILTVYPSEKRVEASEEAFSKISISALAYYLRQKGASEEQSTLEEKYKYLTETYREGSVGFLYRLSSKKLDVTAQNIAVIRKITPSDVTFTVIRRLNTRLATELDLEEYNRRQRENRGDKAAVYNVEDIMSKEYLMYEETVPLVELGADLLLGMTRTSDATSSFVTHEGFYFRKLDGAELVPLVLYLNDKWDYDTLVVDSSQASYAILSDWDVPFDVLDFRNRYLKDSGEPVYEQYRKYNSGAINKAIQENRTT